MDTEKRLRVNRSTVFKYIFLFRSTSSSVIIARRVNFEDNRNVRGGTRKSSTHSSRPLSCRGLVRPLRRTAAVSTRYRNNIWSLLIKLLSLFLFFENRVDRGSPRLVDLCLVQYLCECAKHYYVARSYILTCTTRRSITIYVYCRSLFSVLPVSNVHFRP